MAEQISVCEWGNSSAIRLPKKILEKLNIKVSDVLEIQASGDTITLKKVFKHKSLKERLAEYDGKIEVAEFDWGEPQGREIL